ncbi:MAG: hypothetical protein R3B36_36780 [Polyangiaceae bacterium]
MRRALAILTGLSLSGVGACGAFSSTPTADDDAGVDATVDAPQTLDALAPDGTSPSDAGTGGPTLCANPLLFLVQDNFFPGPDLPSPWTADSPPGDDGGASTVIVDDGGALLASGSLQGSSAVGKVSTDKTATRARVRYTMTTTGAPPQDAQVGCKVVLGKLGGKHMNTRLSLRGDVLTLEADTSGNPPVTKVTGATATGPLEVDVTFGRSSDGGADVLAALLDVGSGFTYNHRLQFSLPNALDLESSVACGIVTTGASPGALEVKITKVTIELCP